MEQLEREIAPFKWVDDETTPSIILDAGEWLSEVFETRADEGFEGNGHDWGSLAQVFLDEQMPELAGVVEFDPEADLFSAYSSDRDALERFARGFHAACSDPAVITDLFSRAELD